MTNPSYFLTPIESESNATDTRYWAKMSLTVRGVYEHNVGRRRYRALCWEYQKQIRKSYRDFTGRFFENLRNPSVDYRQVTYVYPCVVKYEIPDAFRK